MFWFITCQWRVKCKHFVGPTWLYIGRIYTARIMKVKMMTDGIQICLVLVGEIYIDLQSAFMFHCLLPWAVWNNKSMYISGKAAEALRHFDRLVFRDSHVLLNRDIYRISVRNKLGTFHVIKWFKVVNIQFLESIKYLPLYKVIKYTETAKMDKISFILVF